jgi:hypothetical protein
MDKATGKCGGWNAWHDRQPVGPETLYVVGKCTFPTTGYNVELRPAVPQGINAKIYILEKLVHPPAGPANDVITEVEARYSEKTNADYESVQIMPDNVTVPVKEVS